MTNSYIPNEATCPVDLELLGLLLRSPEARVAQIVDAQEPMQRAALAVFCFTRAHMRGLAVLVAKRCSVAQLRASGGLVGELLIEQVRMQASKVAAGRRKVSLARAA